ncbi:hypothetical protein [Streptomyces sp. NPDC086766]|uniref:hypothetical protein n=1 Tax=Streptomyces sp. NPDC086766 TaxID=3365754 RepID=UPI0038047E5F
MVVSSVRDHGGRELRAGKGESEASAPGRWREVLSGPWLLPGHDGRLLVYALVDRSVLRWTESAQGGDHWLGPDILPAPDVTRLTVAQGGNRYVHLIGRQVRENGDGSLTAELVYAIQYQAGRPMSEWRTLGNPQPSRPRSAQTGLPAAAVDAAGALHVFAPTAEGRVLLRREDAKGRWEPWLDLGVTAALDTPAAVATTSGHVALLAPARAGALTWCQRGPDAPMERGHDLPVLALPGSATGLETSPGRVTWYLTDLRGGGIVAARPGEWPVPLGGDPGDGRHAALTTVLGGRPCTVLAHRDAAGRIMLGVCAAEDERNGVWWTDTGTTCLGDPVLARDSRGRVAVLAVAADGGLILARQASGRELVLGDWIRIGTNRWPTPHVGV